MKLDSRTFSQKAHAALTELSDDLERFARKQKSTGDNAKEKAKSYRSKSTGLIQGLPAYISTWGLHRLSGDAKKFSGRDSEDTKYKGLVYLKFLSHLQEFSQQTFDPEQESSLMHLPLRDYTALPFSYATGKRMVVLGTCGFR